MSYYKEEQFLAAVDQNDHIVGRVEKWEAHRKNILHRGYTAIITCGGKFVLQHRKHPVFDNVYDLSFSSHQVYEDDILQSDEAAIYHGLSREWGMTRNDIKAAPRFIKKIYYQARDDKSDFSEHEIDYIYQVEALHPPTAVPDFAYGSRLLSREELGNGAIRLDSPFAPWVQTLLAGHII